jgi:ubiquinone/menaquinone biosynthesis C-methylase UbiE
MKRTPSHELLDSDDGSSEEIAGSLSDLRFINRWFGGMSTGRFLFRRVVDQCGLRELSVLEVAAGSSDVPLAVQRNFKQDGVELTVTTLDRSAAHLPIGTPRVVGDAVALPFSNGSFDVVSCCLFAHHLSPPDLVSFAREASRVARTAVLINDLIRDPLHLALVYAGLPLYRSRLTRNDAPASVRQAYTVGEMHQMLGQVPFSRVDITRRYLYRMAVIGWNQQ